MSADLVSAGASNPRTVQRRLAALVPDDNPLPMDGATLEAIRVGSPEAARLSAAAVVEDATAAAHRVEAPWRPAFAAFLDGTQASRVIRYESGVPIVHGTVGAVIRQRQDRRLTTWAHETGTALYVPRRHLSRPTNLAVDRLGMTVVDITATLPEAEIAPQHPAALLDVAVHAVERDRERLEQRLAEQWCSERHDPLFVDGSISGSPRVASAACAVGVVKSHRLLYADGAALRVVVDLAQGQRSSVLRVAPPSSRRTPVWSWYLRLRETTGHDPMWGLVRVEVALTDVSDPATVSRRADTVSAWILAEATPLSLPDARWHTMVYGIRDCEEFLHAIR